MHIPVTFYSYEKTFREVAAKLWSSVAVQGQGVDIENPDVVFHRYLNDIKCYRISKFCREILVVWYTVTRKNISISYHMKILFYLDCAKFQNVFYTHDIFTRSFYEPLHVIKKLLSIISSYTATYFIIKPDDTLEFISLL